MVNTSHQYGPDHLHLFDDYVQDPEASAYQGAGSNPWLRFPECDILPRTWLM